MMKTSAHELGRAVAEARLVKNAGDALVGRFIRTAVTLAKQAGLNDAAVEDMVERLDFNVLLEKAARGIPGMNYGGQSYNPYDSGGYMGGGMGGGIAYGGMQPGQQPEDPDDYDKRGLLAKMWQGLVGSNMTPMERKAKAQAAANKRLGLKPGQGGRGGWGGGSGGNPLVSRTAQRVGARTGYDFANSGKHDQFMMDMQAGARARMADKQNWNQWNKMRTAGWD